jgi:hypothetical protein
MKSLFHVILTLILSFLISIVSFAQIDTLCEGSLLENYSITPNEGSTYSWSVSGGGQIIGSSDGTSIQVDWSAAPIGLINNAITLTEQLNGCTAEQVLSVEIIDNPIPNLLASNSSICLGDSIVLSAENGYDIYNWTPSVINSSSFTYAPSSLIDNEFSVEVIGEGGCSSSETIQIEIFDLPIVAVSLSDISICLGESVTVSATDGLASYTWNYASVSDAQTTLIPTVSETNFTLSVSDENGCVATDNAILTINQVNPVELLVNGSSTTTICLGETIALDATNGLNSYEWLPEVVNDAGGVYTPADVSETTYSVTTTDAEGCQSIDTISITINDMPSPGPIIFN